MLLRSLILIASLLVTDLGLAIAPTDLGLADLEGVALKGGIASGYYPWIKSPTVPYARYPGAWKLKPRPWHNVCAHRSAPFWSILKLTRGKRVAFCVVLDRGPYGFCEISEVKTKDKRCRSGHEYGVVVNRKLKRGYYRGVIDATPAVHKQMGSSGWVLVKVERLKVPDKRKRILGRKLLKLNSNML